LRHLGRLENGRYEQQHIIIKFSKMRQKYLVIIGIPKVLHIFGFLTFM